MTDQEAFDTAVRHLLSMKEPSCEGFSRGTYYSKNGNKCVIGCLIPPSEYTPSIEGFSVKELAKNNILPHSLRGINIDMLDELQKLHDDIFSWDIDEMNKCNYFSNYLGLAEIAAKYNLKVLETLAKLA